MPKRKGEIWTVFEVLPEPKNGSIVKCTQCGDNIRRGSAEASSGNLNTSSMTSHLRTKHPETLQNIEQTKAEKRKEIEEEEGDEESEMEQGKNMFKLNSKKKREKYLRSNKPQPKISQLFLKSKPAALERVDGVRPEDGVRPVSSVQYKTDDPRAKQGHLAILKMLILEHTKQNLKFSQQTCFFRKVEC